MGSNVGLVIMTTKWKMSKNVLENFVMSWTGSEKWQMS